jgi:hypothetical protein
MALFKEFRDLAMGLDNQEVVVQRYLDKPLLLDGFKFDLRVYVVVIGLEQMKAFICDEGLARFCTVSFFFLLTLVRPNTRHQPEQILRKFTCI